MLPRWAPAAVAKAKAATVAAALVATGGVGGAVALDQVAPAGDHSRAHRHPPAAPAVLPPAAPSATAVTAPAGPPAAAPAPPAAPGDPTAPPDRAPATARHLGPARPDHPGDHGNHGGGLHGRPGHPPGHQARHHAHRRGADRAGATRPAARRRAAPTGRLPRPDAGAVAPDGATGRAVHRAAADPTAPAHGAGRSDPAR